MKAREQVYYNGRIYHRPSVKSPVQAVLISAGKIISVGSNKTILALRSKQSEKINLHDRTVLPGLIDSHIHLVGYAMTFHNLDLSNTRSITEIQDLLRKAAAKRTRKEWIVGRGWDHEKLAEKRYPLRGDLDIVPNPVFLQRVCGHIATVNSAALEICKIDQSIRDPSGGVIDREVGTNQPDGVLEERAIGLVTSRIPRNVRNLEKLLPIAARELLRVGLTSLHSILDDARELQIVRKLCGNGGIPQTVYPIMTIPSDVSISTRMMEKYKAIKLYLDGSLGGRTASLSTAYSDMPSTTGMLRMNDRTLETIMEATKQFENQLCVHAIGDNAVRLAVDSFRRVYNRKYFGNVRHRIEHASLTTPELRSRMGAMGLIASVQPRFIYSDTWARQRLGVRRAKQLYAFKDMQKNGIVLASGSDCPVENPNPFEGIWSAVTRPDGNYTESFTVAEAILSYTKNAAHASFSENTLGLLDVGYNADMIVLDRDPYTCNRQQLRNVKVLKTIVKGEEYLN